MIDYHIHFTSAKGKNFIYWQINKPSAKGKI